MIELLTDKYIIMFMFFPKTLTVHPQFSPRDLIVNIEIRHGGLFEGVIRREGAC